jgi:hypothetical protein
MTLTLLSFGENIENRSIFIMARFDNTWNTCPRDGINSAMLNVEFKVNKNVFLAGKYSEKNSCGI